MQIPTVMMVTFRYDFVLIPPFPHAMRLGRDWIDRVGNVVEFLGLSATFFRPPGLGSPREECVLTLRSPCHER